MSILAVIGNVISENGFGPAPASIFGNTDSLVVQCVALAKKAGLSVATAHNWQNMTRPFSITTVSGTSTYDGPSGEMTYGDQATWRFIGDTFWDSTNYLPVGGSITPQEWQTLKYGVGGTLSLSTRKFRVVNNAVESAPERYRSQIRIYPTPTVSGDVLVCEYVTGFWVNTFSATGNYTFAADTDTTWFPEPLLQLSLAWRLRRAKGFDYTEEYNEYKEQLALAIARDTPAPALNFSYMPAVAWPVNIPQTIPVP